MSSYSHALEKVLIPGYYSLRGRTYPARRTFVERSQWWSADELRAFQWKELRALLEHAFRTVPYYQKKYAAAGITLGDIKTLEHFAQLPPLTREEINSHRDELCSKHGKNKLISHATGGSSGVPTRFYITLDSYDWRCAISARAYSWSGYQIGERALYLWGAPVGKTTRWKNAKLGGYRFLRRERIVPTFVQTPEMWRNTFEEALRFRPKFIVGYVSSLQQFAKYILERELSIAGVCAVLAAAEPVYQATRDLVQQAFNAPLFNTYGSREFMSIAAECEVHNGLHIHADNLVVETRSHGNGPSEFMITDLHNYGMPFIRYEIGDLGILSDKRCPCGRGLPLIRQVEGRILDVLRTQDGRTVPGEFFPHLLKEVGEVREFQVRQKSLEEIDLSLVLARPLSEGSATYLHREIKAIFGNSTRVTVRPVEMISRLPSGKHKVAIGIE